MFGKKQLAAEVFSSNKAASCDVPKKVTTSTVASVSVQSSVIAQAKLFTYTYRTDGLLQNEHVAWTTSGNFSWTYTPAGRELSQSDPLTGTRVQTWTGIAILPVSHTPGPIWTYVPKTYAYDAYGRVARLTLPEGYTQAHPTYDAQGEPLGFAGQDGTGTTKFTQGFAYDVRGDLLGDTRALGNGQPYAGMSSTTFYTAHMANAMALSASTSRNFRGVGVGVGSTDVQSFDARSGMVLSNAASTPNDSPHGFTYDLAGRQVGTTTTIYTSPAQGSQILDPLVTTDVKAYDAQNHLALDGGGSVSVSWRPS